MPAATTLFQLKGDAQGVFDGSVNGISVLKSANARVLAKDAGVSFDAASVDVSRHKDLDNLQTFTIEATITPTTVSGTRHNIVEGQTPAVALFIDPSGKLVGSVHTAAGWITVDSGTSLLTAGKAQRVTFIRDANGRNQLQIDGTTVGSAVVPGPIQNIGVLGLRIGMGMDGTSVPFSGTITDLSVRQGVVTQEFFAQRIQEGLRLETLVKAAGTIKQIAVHLLPDESHSRLQHVKDIMNAAGVQSLSDLDTLPVRQRTPLSRGQVLVAPRKGRVLDVNWAEVARAFRGSTVSTQRELLATHLTNQNSVAFLRAVQPATPPTATPVTPPSTTGPLGSLTTRPTTPLTPSVATPLSPLVPAIGSVPATTLSGVVLQPSPVLLRRSGPALTRPAAGVRITETALHTTEVMRIDNNRVTALSTGLLDALQARTPAAWPTTASAAAQVMELKTVPIDSAVVIAGVLDLTEQQLVVEPNVGTLYIIAEQVICGANATITWQRPGGSTPARLDDPDLNGRGWTGVQTKPDSRDGLDGESARRGAQGIDGARGRTLLTWRCG